MSMDSKYETYIIYLQLKIDQKKRYITNNICEKIKYKH